MNLNVKGIFKKFFDKFFKNQHPEAALRYLPVVSIIKRKRLSKAKILEIGSGSLGITPYLKRQIDGLDVDFSGPKSDYLVKIKGKAQRIPFKKNSYDAVISVDVLEHLQKDIRPEAIYELIRVAKKLVVLVVPVGMFSEKQDKELDIYWTKVFGKRNKFLKEHVTCGLPNTEEVLVWIDQAARKLGKKVKVSSFSNLNLLIRKILMKTWISKSKYLYYLYMKGYLLLLPILRLANFGNCYRRIFMIEFPSPANSHLETYSNRIKKLKGKSIRGTS